MAKKSIDKFEMGESQKEIIEPNKLVFESPEGFAPERGTSGSAGFDVKLWLPDKQRNIVIQPGEIKEIDLEIKHQPPEGYVGILFSRSGKAYKNHVRVFFEGIIDNDFRGKIKALLENCSSHRIQFNKGDKIVQIVYLKYYTGEAQNGQVNETKRGENGFGHTGN